MCRQIRHKSLIHAYVLEQLISFDICLWNLLSILQSNMYIMSKILFFMTTVPDGRSGMVRFGNVNLCMRVL